ncbi:uncharacterized protein LOC133037264 [Cannabis sativa]|uniref:uncharacterized protein LOC133037264 n=1 Tax=Cannabis sativa TaxID=3483 RepID=UPI0029CAA524|nr:uncharacterized protein LOC133037264 [Cannabis sativa]
MNIISWNARGLGNPSAFRYLCLLVQEQAPCVLFIMETKLQYGSIDRFRNTLHFPNGIEVPRQGLGGGLMLLWKPHVTLSINNFSQNHIDCFMENQDGPSLHFTGFYGHPCAAQRHLTWTLLRRCYDISPLSPWLVLGDFNEVLSHEDKIGGPRRVEAQITAFRSAIDTCKLSTIPFQGERTTWTNKHQGNGNVKERLDYGFINSHWEATFITPSITHLDFYNSDHRALKASVSALNDQPEITHFRSRFRFEKIWLKEADCAEIILANWKTGTNNSLLQITNNISNCASSLQQWHFSHFGNLKKEIKESHEHVSALQNSSSTDPHHFEALKNSESILDELLAKEEDYWHQRARISWMKSGDSNTKFFHQRANARSSNNRIKKLRDDAGNTQTSESALLGIISTYFQTIFSSSGINTHAINSILDVIPTTIDAQSREALSAPYTASDVLNALNSMSDDKSPGIDGMSVMFFTNYWHIVGSLVTESVLDVLNNSADPTLLNKTIITLIPKVKKPQLITQYRPISLCIVLYKLISKSIVLRIQPFLPLVISEYQSAFMSQRLITDNVLIAFELLHSLKNRKRGKQGYVDIKLDMSKAFDRVKWHYVAQVMLKMGFGSTMVNLILRCLLNGKVLGDLTPTRGIRQGDPLSPYLFLFCAEGLSRLLQSEENNGSLQGLCVSRTAPSVSHLFFADDSVLFCRATQQSASSIQHVLHIYHQASGQAINPDKCVLSFSPNKRPSHQRYFQQLLNMPIQPCHEEYLGLPSFAGRDKTKLFSGITDKIWKLLSRWKEQLFSAGGKEVLLKAVVQAIPTYAMSCFRLPVTLCNQIESMMANFWWGSTSSGNAIHWKNWNSLCKAKVHGGLGFRNFIHFNQALLAKQAWRILESPNSLLSRVLHHRYFLNGSFLTAGLGACPSLTWRSIVWGKELLAKGLRWRVGIGDRINCKSDPWLPGHTEFTPFNFIGNDNSLQVADLITQNRQWDLTTISANFGQADIDIILSIPLTIYPSDDILIWNGTNSGNYMVKSGYYFASSLAELNDAGSTFSSENWWTKFWKLKLPSKLRIFVSKVYHNVLPVAAELNRKHIAESPYCPLCKMQKESINHALFLCSRAKEVWCFFPHTLNFKLAATTTSEEFLLYVSANTSTPDFEQFLTLCWSIWFERNAEFHGKLPKQPAAIFTFATGYISKYQTVHNSQQITAVSPVADPTPTFVSPNAPSPTPWIAPPVGKWKLNTDAACNRSNKLIGIGAVLRDSNGYIKAAFSKSIIGCFKPEEMEATAMALSLQWLINLGLTADFIETDSLLVVQGLKAALHCNSAFHSMLKDVNYLVSFFPRAQVTHVRRSANTYADVLAKFALTVDADCWRNFHLHL